MEKQIIHQPLRSSDTIKNVNNPDITFDAGTIIRGKYTFPNNEAFAVKVEEVEIRQLLK